MLILLTNWGASRDSNAKGHSHRNGLVQYTKERLDKNKVRAISLQDPLPVVGVCVFKEKKIIVDLTRFRIVYRLNTT